MSINQRNPQPEPHRALASGVCYLALTFGTLLSSQGADARQLGPFGLSSLATFPTVRRSRGCSPAWVLRGPWGPGRRNRDKGTRPQQGSAGRGPETPATPWLR